MSAPAGITFVRHEEREAETKPLDFGLISKILRFTRPHAKIRGMLVSLVVLRAFLLPSLAWAIGAVIGGPVARMDLHGIALGVAGYAGLVALTHGSFVFRIYLALKLGERVVSDLRSLMFRHLQKMSMGFFNRTKTGRIISRFTSDAEAVRIGVQDALFVTVVGAGQMLVASAFMLYYDPVLFLIVAALAPAMWGLNRVFHGRLSRAYRDAMESFSRITATLAESVKGVRVTQGFARQDLNADIFEDLVTDHARYNLAAAKASGVFLPLLETNSQIFIAAILLIGGMRVFSGATEMAALYQFILMAGVFFGPLQTLGNQYNNAMSAMAGAERVFRFLEARPDWSEPPEASELPGLRGRIEFREVGFGYDPAKPVLRGVSFTAETGSTTALVGPTGSGKTTIINLIAKFYLPESGQILVDGRDILSIRADSLHRQMGIVLQQNFLFSGTVADNIRVGRPSAEMADIVEAARKLDCLDLLASLPDGLGTQIGEGGTGVSLGQRQLICFTRAMLADPRILILDEATSSVDTITEARIQKALATLLAGRTSFVVAHRLSTIRGADRVLVLEDGRIIEQGKHRQLLARHGVYAMLYKQFVS